jgi:hypothetical protein
VTVAAPQTFAIPSDDSKRKAWWGVRYVQSVCSQGGYVFRETPSESDVHSFDGDILFRPSLSVSVQIKCTSQRFVRRKSFRIKDAWRNNWTGLYLPGYFVVVSVEPDIADWMSHRASPRETVLRSSAFWSRIDPLDEGATHVNVETLRRFTVATLDEWAGDLETAIRNFGGGTT